jgi:hypothetical protein
MIFSSFIVFSRSKAVLQLPPFSQALIADEYVISFLVTPSTSIWRSKSIAILQSRIFSQTFIKAL